MLRKTFLLIPFFTLPLSLSIAQTNYYVNYSEGSDSPGQGNAPNTGAWKTIEYAINNVANPTIDEIIINITGEIYNLANDQIEINRDFANLKLIGTGIDQTIIQAESDTALSSSRVIKIYSGNNVQIKDLTVRYGRSLKSDRDGGGILNQGTLSIDFCKITQNLCNKNSNEGGIGGGIANDNGSLTISNSTINYNTGSLNGQGGGIGSRNGILNITNSTISHNIGRLTVGGIFVSSNGGDAVFNMENCTVFGNTAIKYGGIRITIFGYPNSYNVYTNINSSTIFNNSAVDVYGGLGLTVPSNCTIKNTIIAGNFAYNNGTTPSPSNLTGSSGSVTVNSAGYNIFQNIDRLTIVGEINNGIGLDPLLLQLADNNSSNGTQTCAIAENSPAKDAIPSNSPNGAPEFDQRGAIRNGNYDIGAYEYWTDNALPVELSSFTAKLVNKQVLLRWRTESEVNNYGFEVQKLEANSLESEWESIVFVEGYGNSNSPKEYLYADNNLIGESKILYRLKQIDNDGKFEYSKSVGIEILPNEYALFQNYPNPFNPVTKIGFRIPEKSEVTITVYDILGNKIMDLLKDQKSAGDHVVNLNMENQPSGIYFYTIIASNPDDKSINYFFESKKMTLLK